MLECRLWPGGGGVVDEPASYSYADPAPQGFTGARVKPAEAYFQKALGDSSAYEAVRKAADPQGMLLDFLQSTYDAAADLAKWDRSALECAPGMPRRPRPV